MTKKKQDKIRFGLSSGSKPSRPSRFWQISIPISNGGGADYAPLIITSPPDFHTFRHPWGYG